VLENSLQVLFISLVLFSELCRGLYVFDLFKAVTFMDWFRVGQVLGKFVGLLLGEQAFVVLGLEVVYLVTFWIIGVIL
jgi:hypothetical protein